MVIEFQVGVKACFGTENQVNSFASGKIVNLVVVVGTIHVNHGGAYIRCQSECNLERTG